MRRLHRPADLLSTRSSRASTRPWLLGFVLATLIAVPLGIALRACRSTVNAAINPLVQIFKPVSPLAWLPIVTMVVSAPSTSTTPTPSPKCFVISAITVMLCSLWPTLINTALGVASIDKDLINVGRVLQARLARRSCTKLVLPSALPLIFTGLRLSLGVGWMVLIAAEMLAQNPGLGKFVWDEFQNGCESRSRGSWSRCSPSASSASCSTGSCSRSRPPSRYTATR